MRQWEIIEQGRGDYGRGMGFRLPDDPEEAYRQGCEDGYKKGYGDAMRESNGGMDYRGGMGFRDGGQGSIGEHYPQYPVRGRMAAEFTDHIIHHIFIAHTPTQKEKYISLDIYLIS